MSTPAPDTIQGFAPIVGEQAQTLILGSMPSVLSLQQRQYYGHPRNRFWPLMGVLFDAGPEHPYARRVERLIQQRIAVWDVLARCVRPGSLDASIARESEVANPVDQLLRTRTSIRRILFNGRAAEQLFQRHLASECANLRVETIALPSTSPANAAYSLEKLIQHWQSAFPTAD